MGCTAAKKGKKYVPPPISTSAGILKITITDGVILHQAGLFKMDPYVKLKLSNQQKISKVVQKGGKNPEFNETFVFYINSSNKLYGRNLQMTLLDRKKIGSDNFVGFGLVDLNPIIDLKKAKDSFRCMLNYEYQEAGFLNIVAEFEEEPAEVLNFRFNQAIIRRETSSFGQMNCWVQVTIGQETMRTKKQKDMKKKPPSWQNEVISMKILASIKHCEIKVMDDNQQIGHMVISMQKFSISGIKESFVEDFVYEQGIYAGTLKFEIFKGSIPAYLSENKDLVKDDKYFGTMMAKPDALAEQTKGQ